MFAKVLAQCGAKTAILDLNLDAALAVADEITAEGYIAKAYKANVLEKDSLEAVHQQVLADFGPCDILINGAGGNNPRQPLPTNTIIPATLTKILPISLTLTRTGSGSFST